MERKNLGQKVLLDRIFDSLRLIFQRLRWSIFFGFISYLISFNYFVGLKFIYVPFAYYFYNFIETQNDVFSRKLFKFNDIESKIFIYKKMNDLIQKYQFISLAIFLSVSVIIFIISSKIFKYTGKKLNEGRHYRGLKIVNKKQLENEIVEEIKSKETGLKYTEFDIYIGKENIRIPRNLGANMWGYLGNSGTGKSQGIISHLMQLMRYKEKVIIVDPAGEYCKHFCRKDDVILSLYDVRSENYSFWNEGLHPMRIAKSLIEDLDGNGAFWSKAGQALFAGLLSLNDNPQDMYNTLFLEYEELKSKFKEKGLAAGIILGEAEQAGGILSTAAVDLTWLKDMNYWPNKCGKKDPFSIVNWVKNSDDKRWVFLTYSDKHKDICKPLVRLWSDIAVLAGFECGVDKKNVPVWLVCDELSSIGKLPSMSLLEDRGRKYNMGLIAGFQTPSQLEVIYGKALAKVIMQGLQNLLFFRANEQEMLEYMSQLCGEAEYIQTTSSNTFGVKNSESISDQVIRKRNVLPDEFKALKNMNAYLKVSSHNPTRIKIQYIELPIINKPEMSYVPDFDTWDGIINGVKVINEEKQETDEHVENTSTIIVENVQKLEQNFEGSNLENIEEHKNNSDDESEPLLPSLDDGKINIDTPKNVSEDNEKNEEIVSKKDDQENHKFDINKVNF